ncbi:unnamed protein product, partial [Symbiodinium sp. KB8]
MSVTVEVRLLSGRAATVQAGLDEEVNVLTRRATTIFGVGKGRLLDSSGNVLDGRLPIREAGVQTGHSLTLHINQIQLQSSRDPAAGAFAAILGDKSVVTWGDARYGGDSSAVQDQLMNVQQIQAARFAFAAILGDGSVVTWGDANFGGDSSAVQDQLTNVQQIQASGAAFAVAAFAAILRDGCVVTWGYAPYGGDSTTVQDQMKNVQQIQATYRAFAAILGDGPVVAWGFADFGGDSSDVQDEHKDNPVYMGHDRRIKPQKGIPAGCPLAIAMARVFLAPILREASTCEGLAGLDTWVDDIGADFEDKRLEWAKADRVSDPWATVVMQQVQEWFTALCRWGPEQVSGGRYRESWSGTGLPLLQRTGHLGACPSALPMVEPIWLGAAKLVPGVVRRLAQCKGKAHADLWAAIKAEKHTRLEATWVASHLTPSQFVSRFGEAQAWRQVTNEVADEACSSFAGSLVDAGLAARMRELDTVHRKVLDVLSARAAKILGAKKLAAHPCVKAYLELKEAQAAKKPAHAETDADKKDSKTSQKKHRAVGTNVGHGHTQTYQEWFEQLTQGTTTSNHKWKWSGLDLKCERCGFKLLHTRNRKVLQQTEATPCGADGPGLFQSVHVSHNVQLQGQVWMCTQCGGLVSLHGETSKKLLNSCSFRKDSRSKVQGAQAVEVSKGVGQYFHRGLDLLVDAEQRGALSLVFLLNKCASYCSPQCRRRGRSTLYRNLRSIQLDSICEA